MTGKQLGSLVIAYEQLWPIGTGRTARAKQSQEAHQHIHQRVRAGFGGTPRTGCYILYRWQR